MPNIVVKPNGQIQFIYHDELRGLLDEGQASIKRVSHVEPNQAGEWEADLSPVGGPGASVPIHCDREALNAEVAYLNTNVL